MSGMLASDECFLSVKYLVLKLYEVGSSKGKYEKSYDAERRDLSSRTKDAAWVDLLSPFWDQQTETINLASEESFDDLVAKWGRRQLQEAEAANAYLGLPIEFINVEHFCKSYERESRRKLELGNKQTRSIHDQDRYESNAARNWDEFYARNTDKFYKNRYYLFKDFPCLHDELVSRAAAFVGDKIKVLEIGCGVGNAIFPIAERFECCEVLGIDFSKNAIDMLNKKAKRCGIDDRCKGFVQDISKADSSSNLKLCTLAPSCDFATLIFVLSAVSPDKMLRAAKNVVECLKPGGILLFRDYGKMDQAQMRFAPEQRLAESQYVRQDGTRSFFFTLSGLSWLFERQCGLERLEARYIKRIVFLRSKKIRMRRVFAHCIYRKLKS